MKIRLEILAAGIAAVMIASAARAGGRDGGGGGAFVARDANGNVTDVELLDLFEARSVNGQPLIPYSNDPIDNQVNDALQRLGQIDSDFAGKVKAQYIHIQAPGGIVHGGADLEINPPQDALNNVSKKGSTLEGMMYYDDVRDHLVVKDEVFNAQKTNTEKAASYLHESVYRVMRKEYSAKDSILSRMLNGCLFATDFAACLNLKPIATPGNARKSWECKLRSDEGKRIPFHFYVFDVGGNVIGGRRYPAYQFMFMQIGSAHFHFDTGITVQSTGNVRQPNVYLEDVSIASSSIVGLGFISDLGLVPLSDGALTQVTDGDDPFGHTQAPPGTLRMISPLFGDGFCRQVTRVGPSD